MSDAVRKLEPTIMWNHFADLNEVPRPSKKEERVIEFIKKFGESLGLPTYEDEVGNVIIKKKGSPGMENRTTIAIQSHLDMVHQKNAGTDFDFDTEGIKMIVDGDWVKADGTTLGADNGIGVASIMAVLSSNEIVHPPIEALFTIDEETGMTGAMGLKGGLLDAKIMLNLDTEDDDEITIGCAGGIDVTASGSYASEPAGSGIASYRIEMDGLTGGHSGMDIHRGRGNANKLMNRLLWNTSLKFDMRLHSVDGGSLRNAIPRESVATVTIPNHSKEAFCSAVEALGRDICAEHGTTDPDMNVRMSECDSITTVMSKRDQDNLLRAIYACPLGIYRMSPDIDSLVQTSNNVARILVENGNYSIQCLTRSSVDSEKMDEAEMIKCAFEQMGAKVDFGGSYPGWTPKPGAAIVEAVSATYTELFGEKAHVNACHAGLECGILGTNYPEIEMISFGPNIRGAHSPDEKVQISSVDKYWKLFMTTLERIQ